MLCVVFFKIDIKMQPYTLAFYQNSYWFLIFAGSSLKMSCHIMALICSIFYKLEQQIKQDLNKGSSFCHDENLDIKFYGRSSDTFWYINQKKGIVHSITDEQRDPNSAYPPPLLIVCESRKPFKSKNVCSYNCLIFFSLISFDIIILFILHTWIHIPVVIQNKWRNEQAIRNDQSHKGIIKIVNIILGYCFYHFLMLFFFINTHTWH